jgi:hypothetical protein
MTITDTTVCGGSQVPVKMHLTGAAKWRLIYEENGVQSIINNIQATDTSLLINRTPSGALSSYTFKIDSLKDANKCIALTATLTGSRKINVYKIPKAEAGIPVDAICGPDYQLAATPSVGTGTWTWKKITAAPAPGSPTFAPNLNDPNSKVTVDLSTSEWKPEYKFVWKETNWNCTDNDSVRITFFKPTDLIAPMATKNLYSYAKIDTLTAPAPLVGKGIWTILKSNDTLSNNSVVFNLSLGENKFEWKITNGSCSSKIEYIINVFDIKIPQGFSPDGNGINDEFIIDGIDLGYNDVTLRIRNSAGTEVFYTDSNNWSHFKGEHTNGTPLPEGTYYYLLTIKPAESTGKADSRSGFIILKRIKSK